MLEFRAPREDELRSTLAVGNAASGEELRDDDYELARPHVLAEELVPGALYRATELFRTPIVPYTPEEF
jgi:hypothetical protein